VNDEAELDSSLEAAEKEDLLKLPVKSNAPLLNPDGTPVTPM
jgi:hypothetical protein